MNNGTTQWLIQRFTALILLAYTLYLGTFFYNHPVLDYATFSAFFDGLFARLAGTLTILALAAHTWIGLWSISTDYLTRRALGSIADSLRLLFLLVVWLSLFIYVGAVLSALWSHRSSLL